MASEGDEAKKKGGIPFRETNEGEAAEDDTECAENCQTPGSARAFLRFPS